MLHTQESDSRFMNGYVIQVMQHIRCYWFDALLKQALLYCVGSDVHVGWCC